MSEAFFQEPRIIEVCGKSIALRPFKSRQLDAAGKLAAPFIELLVGEDGGVEGALTPSGIQAILTHVDEVIKLIALATGESEDWVGDLLPDDLLKLAAEVIRVNADFFIRRLMPAFTEILGELAGAVGDVVGPASSSPSESTASAQTK